MDFPERFENLPLYAFSRLRELLDGVKPAGQEISMTIGEPRHPFPEWVTDIIVKNSAGFNDYPANEGIPELKEEIMEWVQRRYSVTLDPQKNILALNGTREGLYNSLIALCPEQKNSSRPIVMVPNPFYQVYMASSLTVNAEPYFVEALPQNNHLPDFSAVPTDILQRTAAVYLCSPSNPQGAVATMEYWIELLKLAEQYDFIIFADECYSEIYRDRAPVGALEALNKIEADPERLVVFHSLSKRSNLPGLRSGFLATGPENLKRLSQLKSYGGAPLPKPLQYAAAAVWKDEKHVKENRKLYAAKYKIADDILSGLDGYTSPEAGFFLWIKVQDSEKTCLNLWRETGVRVLPGAYLAQEKNGKNPGQNFIRVALVAEQKITEEALTKIRSFLEKQ
jgi:aspartate/methionine/tyrosine aminotransferase